MSEKRATGIFRTAHEAVSFALNYGESQAARDQVDTDKALDGAGTVGIIKRHMEALPLQQLLAVMAGRVAREDRCDCDSRCCQGWKLTREFEQITAVLAACAAEEIPGLPVQEYRVAVVRKHFGAHVDLDMTARRYGVGSASAAAHGSVIQKWVAAREAAGYTALSASLDAAGLIDHRKVFPLAEAA
ncbi:hypothetical protein KDX08_30210 [Burkholderia cenocepacia]|uniref:hypothetical protein n=1 Tax=Burkholderia cepacia complex TaxID=87882 RepID=UPI00159489CC|nr:MULTISPECIES: hypothetical protein [Burkholderia cepacia complex]MBR7996729.1 hypothetical protein [Burkholderia cenocepacia]